MCFAQSIEKNKRKQKKQKKTVIGYKNKTLKTHKGLCFDYANLFAAVCRSQNVPCFVLNGYRKTDSSSLHTWNRVYFNNTWYNVDVTFDDCTKGTKYGFHKIERYNSPDDNYVITNLY